MSPFPDTAESLAADLAGARVDPNEAQKALAYLRSKHGDQEYGSQQFFDYLCSIVQNGRVVMRSGQTLGYYRDLQLACERHLRGMSVEEMAFTLGWAVRLLRYYRVVPDAVPEVAIQQTSPSARRPTVPPARPHSEPASPRPAPAQPPVAQPRSIEQEFPVGKVFAGKVLEVEAAATIVQIPGFSEEAAFGVIKTEMLSGKQYTPGNLARVEVLSVRQLKSGRTILDLKLAPKQEKK